MTGPKENEKEQQPAAGGFGSEGPPADPPSSPIDEENSSRVGAGDAEGAEESGTFQSTIVDNFFSDINADEFKVEQKFDSVRNVSISLGRAADRASLGNYQKVSREDYRVLMTTEEITAIDVIARSFSTSLDTAGALVINNMTGNEGLDMLLVDQLALCRQGYEAFSCVIEKGFLTIADLVTDFSKDRRFSKHRKKILVINEKRESVQAIEGFVRSVSRKGGAGATLKSMLTELNLQVIYVCVLPQNASGVAQEDAICTIDTLGLLIFRQTGDYLKALQLARSIRTVSYTTGWLSRASPEAMMDQLLPYLTAGTLEEEIAKQKGNINEEEERTKIGRQLADDPLKNMILFTACFFEKLSPGEFDKLVRLFIGGHGVGPLHGVQGNADHAGRWEYHADTLIDECGLLTEDGPKGTPAYYRFEKSRCHELAREIFTRQFRQVLIRRFENIRQNLLVKDFTISENCVNGIVGLAFINAQTETENILTDVCMQLVSILPEANDEVATKIHLRLLAFLQQWQADARYTKSIENLYANLKANQEYRTIFLTLFTVLCSPAYAGNLPRLKALLSTMEREELFSGIHNNDELEMLCAIFENYTDHFGDFATEINDWIMRRDEKVAQTYAYIVCAMLRLLQGGRMSRVSRDDLSYKLITAILSAPDAKERFIALAGFLFSAESRLAYMQLFRGDYRSRNRRAPVSVFISVYFSFVPAVQVFPWPHPVSASSVPFCWLKSSDCFLS